MKRSIKRIVSIVIAVAFFAGFIPVNEHKAVAASNGVVSIENDYIAVNVSEKNGGFTINTVEGDRLKKSDNNKALLYHRDEYDTSFTSFEVTYADGSVREYLFGGSYGFLGMSGSPVRVTKVSDREITAVWKLDTLTFTQNITLVSSGANEHGMVSIAYYVENRGGSAVRVRARLLLDTALGSQDYGIYQVIDENNRYRTIKSETVLTASDSIPQNFFAYDDPYIPSVTAYTVSKQGQVPYQVAIGHWNNLASTLFSFAPDSSLDFTDAYNKYLTNDSAYALYYDLGSIPASGTGDFLTYYGVYAHQDVTEGSTVTVDVTAPTALTLDRNNKSKYVSLVNKGIADFSVQMTVNNLLEEGAKDYDSMTVAIYTVPNLMPLDSRGQAIPGHGYDSIEPYTLTYADVRAGGSISDTLLFSTKPNMLTEFRKIKIQVFDTSSGSTLTEDKLLAETVFYILCPGTLNLPKFCYTSVSPEIIYYTGTRHLFVMGANMDLVYTSIQNGNCVLKAYKKSETGATEAELTIPRGNVLQPDRLRIDVILTETMATGDWYLQFEWSDDAVQNEIVTEEDRKQTGPTLKFVVSDNKAYKNDTYGVVAVVQTKGGDSIPAYRIMSCYPNLLGLDDIPVFHDAETGRTLYMRIGTNISDAVGAEITGSPAETPVLMSTPTVYSSWDKKSHKFNLGIRSVSEPSDALIVVYYNATSLENAENTAQTIITGGIRDGGGTPYGIVLYNGSNINEANANVTYDSETGRGCFAFTMTEDGCFGKDWFFETPVAADIILYNVDAVPEITSVEGTISGRNIIVTWSGTQLTGLDSVRFYLVSDTTNMDDCGYILGELTDSAAIGSGSRSFAIPSNVVHGDVLLCFSPVGKIYTSFP